MILLFAVLAVLAAGLDPAPGPVAGQGRASDGDSFRLGADRVRLLGMDAPELAQDCNDSGGRSWPCGRVARDRLAAILSGGPVDCRPEDYDQFNRLLATCQVDRVDIAARLVSEGLAISADRYRTEEARARQDRHGIWAGDFEAPRNWRADHPRPQGNWNLLSFIGL